VSADSTVRALYAGYDGPLYQVRRASDHVTTNIGPLAAGGLANAAEQDRFRAGTTCAIAEIYDQSPRHNNPTVEGKGADGPADTVIARKT
jgi:non-reducing end alpha-L-arabinofuranosidase